MATVDTKRSQAVREAGRWVSEPAIPPVHVAGQELRVFTDSPAYLDAILDDFRQARRRIWIEAYIFAADAAGWRVAAALRERAAAGVDVRVIYDAIGSYSTPQAFFDELAAGGVQVHCYHGFSEALLRFEFFRVLNRRNHRKLIVVDDRAAYFGGMNIVDQSGIHSVQDAQAQHLPKSAGWRDVQMRMTGTRVAELADCMDHLWRRVVRHQRRLRLPRWRLGQFRTTTGEGLWFFASMPQLKARRPSRVFLPLIRRAQRTITLSMAYFVPQSRVLRALLKAAKRGVKVRVIMPEESDVPAVQWAARSLYARLLKAGIRLYERRDQMLHSKVMIVDDVWTVVGSCNLDARSLRWNLELLAVARSEPLAAEMNRLCAFELRHSRRIAPADCDRRPWWHRLRNYAAWLLRRWL